MAERSADNNGPEEPSQETLVDIVETTTEESRAENKRTYQLIIGGGVLLLATSLHHTRPAGPVETDKDNIKAIEEEYETITVMGSGPEKERREVARFTKEFTPPLSSDDERVRVVGHLAVVTFAALASTHVFPSAVELPLPEDEPGSPAE